jgi:hypothetical protein
LGVSDLPFVVVPHPLGGISAEEVQKRADGAIDNIIRTATRPPEASVAGKAEGKNKFKGTLEELYNFMVTQGWSDGLPMMPPTEEAVKWMLKGTDRSPDEVVALLPPKDRKATIEKIAANAVMAGARPEYMPVIIAAIELIAGKDFNERACDATTADTTTLLMISGPIAEELNINSKAGAIGGGWRANTTIGRAVRLTARNVGGVLPGVTKMSIWGTPANITSYVLAESEDALPSGWEPLRVELGYDRAKSTISAACIEHQVTLQDSKNETASRLMAKLITQFVPPRCPDKYDMGMRVVMLAPEHAHLLAGESWTKDDIKRYLVENAYLDLPYLRECGTRIMEEPSEDMRVPKKPGMVRIIEKPKDLTLIVAGGAGKYSKLLRIAFSAKLTTKEIKLPANWQGLLEKAKE